MDCHASLAVTNFPARSDKFLKEPGGPPPVEDPDNPAHFPIEPDDGSMPPPTLPEDEGLGWKPQV
jgi:hypothetical protein